MGATRNAQKLHLGRNKEGALHRIDKVLEKDREIEKNCLSIEIFAHGLNYKIKKKTIFDDKTNIL